VRDLKEQGEIWRQEQEQYKNYLESKKTDRKNYLETYKSELEMQMADKKRREEEMAALSRYRFDFQR
jgi:multidrug resistance efflux pump